MIRENDPAAGQPTISWTITKLSKFKKALEKAVENHEQVFDFDGHEFFTGYAAYLVEYLNGEFHIKKTS